MKLLGYEAVYVRADYPFNSKQYKEHFVHKKKHKTPISATNRKSTVTNSPQNISMPAPMIYM